MGIIILQLSDANVSYSKLGFLETFKDIPIAIISFFAVNYINKFGTKISLIFSLFIVAACSFAFPFVEAFWFYKLWFSVIGIGFGIAKISVFGIMRDNTSDEKKMSEIMNNVEAAFMIGIFVVNIGFGWLISGKYAIYWKFGFWFIGIFSLLNILLLLFTNIKEIKQKQHHLNVFSEAFKLINKTTIFFFLVIFFIVFTEQNFNSWLPSFYKRHLKIDSFFALQASSFLALFSYIGRIITAKIIQKYNLEKYFKFCVRAIMLILIISISIQLLFSENSKILLFLFPLIGFFTAPLYPIMNSKMLSSIKNEKANLFTSVIVIFSSLGSSAGSIFIAIQFQNNLMNYFSLCIFGTIIILYLLSLLSFKFSSSKIE